MARHKDAGKVLTFLLTRVSKENKAGLARLLTKERLGKQKSQRESDRLYAKTIEALIGKSKLKKTKAVAVTN